MKQFLSFFFFIGVLLVSQQSFGQFDARAAGLDVPNFDQNADMYRLGVTGFGFPNNLAFINADPALRARVLVQNGILGHYVNGAVGQLDNSTWCGLGIGNPGAPITPYGFSMARSNNVGFLNLLQSTIVGGVEDVIAGFGAATTTARNRFVVRAYNNAANAAFNFKDILIANPNGAVGVNQDPFASFWVNSSATNNPGFPTPIFKSMVIVGDQVDKWSTASAIGNQQNSSLASDKVLVEGFRAQTPDFFNVKEEGVAVNLQVVRNDREGAIPKSLGGITDDNRGEYAELTWQSVDFQSEVTNKCDPIGGPNFDKNFYISFRNGFAGTPGNNSFSPANKLPVATFTPRGRVGIATTTPTCEWFGNPVFLEVNGGAILGGAFFPSDARYKTNVQPISNALELVKKMQGTTYEMKHADFPSKNFMVGKQYGFIAQELEKVIPELAAKGSDGYYAVNYISLIPVLSQAIKEQDAIVTTLKEDNSKKDAEIARLNAEIQDIRNDIANLKNLTLNQSGNTGYKLFQNTPNPSSALTSIGYVIPNTASFASASVNVYDLSGRLLQSYPASAGQNNVNVNVSNLASGTYLYDLLVDGQQLEVKRMVIIKNY